MLENRETVMKKSVDNSFNGQYGVYRIFVTIFRLQKRWLLTELRDLPNLEYHLQYWCCSTSQGSQHPNKKGERSYRKLFIINWILSFLLASSSSLVASLSSFSLSISASLSWCLSSMSSPSSLNISTMSTSTIFIFSGDDGPIVGPSSIVTGYK